MVYSYGIKKYIFGAILTISILVSPVFAQASGLTDAQIQAILAILSSFGADSATIANVNSALTGGTPASEKRTFCHNFDRDLTVGNSGDEVSALMKALQLNGTEVDSDGTIDSIVTFKENVAAAVVQFQAKYGIRQTGYVGPMTRAKLNALYGCSQQKPVIPITSCPVLVRMACPTGQHYEFGPTTYNVVNCPVQDAKCVPDSTVFTVSEQVKCIFNGATTEQKCWGDVSLFSTTGAREPAHYGCSGIGTCVVTVTAPKGAPPVSWGSSCGGSASTKIDGQSENVNFSCPNTQTIQTPVSPVSTTDYIGGCSAPPAINMPDATVGVPYRYQVTGTYIAGAPYPSLPSGLTANSNYIEGTPTVSGSFSSKTYAGNSCGALLLNIRVLSASSTTNIASATIDQSSLISNSATPTISGTAANVSGIGITVSNLGGKVFGSGKVSMIGNKWAVTVLPMLPALGTYTVSVYDYTSNALLTTGTFTMTSTSGSSTPLINLKVNGSSGPITASDNQQITVVWSTSSPFFTSCKLSAVRESPSTAVPDPILNLPPNGSRTVYAWVPLVRGATMVTVYCQNANETIKDSNSVQINGIAPVPATGTYMGYMGGSVTPFIITNNVSRQYAVDNCQLNASNNPNTAIHCTWNGEEVYSREGTTAAVTITAATQPASSTLTPVIGKPFTKFTLTNNTNSVVTINGVVVQRTGSGADGILIGVELVDSANSLLRYGDMGVLNPNTHQVTIGSSFTINPGETKSLTVLGDTGFNLSSFSGQTVGLSVISVNASAAVTGALPITGAQHTVTAP
ncbi:peptidoglycan-binding protein [Candidatus Kaiserbacteria bacterium]|nr:peptidoglycan-binding protein [Candidatus Kaiserbacteria bacterium]